MKTNLNAMRNTIKPISIEDGPILKILVLADYLNEMGKSNSNFEKEYKEQLSGYLEMLADSFPSTVRYVLWSSVDFDVASSPTIQLVEEKRAEKKSEFWERVEPVKPEIDFAYYADLFLKNGWLRSDCRNGNIMVVKDAIHIDGWVQDPFIIGNDQGKFVLIKSYYPAKMRWVDHFIPDVLSHAKGYSIRTTPAYLEGGDVLSGKDFVIVGRTTLQKNLKLYENQGSPIEYITQKFRNTYSGDLGAGPHVVFIPNEGRSGEAAMDYDGASPPGLNHLDLYMTLGGMHKGEEIIFLGEITNGSERFAEKRRWLEHIKKWLEGSFAKIIGRSVKVKRWPLYPRSKTYLSYNNCHIELRNEERMIYFPDYMPDEDENPNRYRKLMQVRDKMIREIEEMKYTTSENIHFVRGGFRARSTSGGSLHCITKVLERGPAPS